MWNKFWLSFFIDSLNFFACHHTLTFVPQINVGNMKLSEQARDLITNNSCLDDEELCETATILKFMKERIWLNNKGAIFALQFNLWSHLNVANSWQKLEEYLKLEIYSLRRLFSFPSSTQNQSIKFYHFRNYNFPISVYFFLHLREIFKS